MQLMSWFSPLRAAAPLAAGLALACTDLAEMTAPDSRARLSHGEEHGTIYVMVQTDPDGATGSFSFNHDVGANSSPAVPNPFNVADGGIRIFNSVVAGAYTITQNPRAGWDLAPGWEEDDTECLDPTDNSAIDLETRAATVNLAPGETVICTFVNRKRATVSLAKRENGSLPLSQSWTFELRTGASAETAGTTHATGTADTETGEVTFACAAADDPNCAVVDDVPHFRADSYQLCEVGMAANYSNNLSGFTPAEGFEEGSAGASECIEVSLGAGAAETTLSLLGLEYIDNVFSEPTPEPGPEPEPSADPRSAVQWSKSSSCSGGIQHTKAVAGGEPALDDFLPSHAAVFPVGRVNAMNCAQANNILSRRDLDGTVKGGDAAYSLAQQLLAAKLNAAAGARMPQCIAAAVADAQALLDNSVSSGVEFTGVGDYLGPRNPWGKVAKDLTNLLNRYNNNVPPVVNGNCD